MRRFGKNVFRLAGQNKASFLGAVFIIAIGIFIYVAMMDTLRNLRDQVDSYYQTNVMADIFAQVSGISETELARLEEIPGIAKASGKMAEDVRLLGAGQEGIVTVHLLSYDAEDAVNRMNLSVPLTDREGLYLGSKMAAVYGYETREPLKLLWDGRAVDFVFSGVCNGPDYIYSFPPGGSMIPDGDVYDIACIDKGRMEELTGRRDSLNELGFILTPGYAYEDVRYPLQEQLQPYGVTALSARERQASYNMVNNEITQLVSIGQALPGLFMSISIFMLYVVLKKMIDRDQSLIGTMKAFGMTDRELMGAYLVEGVLVGVGGALLGGLPAMPFGRYMFTIFADFFDLPETVYRNYLNNQVMGLVIAVGTGVTAVFLGVREILSIVPAQAMRAKSPTVAWNLPLPRGLARRLGTLEKMGCRSIARNPFRGFLIVLAVAFPFAMLSVLLSYNGVADQMFFDQFEKIQRYDLQLSLDRYVSPQRAVQSGAFLPGVEAAEAACTTYGELIHENQSEFVMISGLQRDSEMWKIMDIGGTYYKPPQRGLILNARIANKLHVEAGDRVEVLCPGMTVADVYLPVTAVIAESLGNGCYMSLESFAQVFQTEAPANTVLLKAQPGMLEPLKQKITGTSQVTWLVDTEKIVDSYRAMMGTMFAMMGMFSFMAVSSGGILIYNISMINIRERVTEFGTLMILGESNREITRLILFEQMTYFVLGILLGIPGSRWIKWLLEHMVDSDSYTIEMTIGMGAYVAAFAICLGIALLACVAEARFVANINLTEIMKERE